MSSTNVVRQSRIVIMTLNIYRSKELALYTCILLIERFSFVPQMVIAFDFVLHCFVL